MKRWRFPAVTAVTALVLAVCMLSPGAALAQEGTGENGGVVSIQELVDHMEEYNDREVTIEGEVIGEIMRRGEFAWITVNDDAYSERTLDEGEGLAGYTNMGIGVWVATADTEFIEFLGGYKAGGDRVDISGVFHRACPEHGGDTDIHALSIRLVERGHAVSHPFNYTRLLVALALLAGCVALWVLRRSKIRRARHRERGTTHKD